jgi:antitoxin (DNA-binding transcriptional repressor) of toxin-antitoxin stability system
MFNRRRRHWGNQEATCAAVLDEVARTGRTVTITRRGKSVAEVRPPSPQKNAKRKLGTMAGEIEIVGDILAPVGAFDEYETIREWDELNSDETAAGYAHMDLGRERKPKARPGSGARHRKPAQ